jgi:hypothetical protein
MIRRSRFAFVVFLCGLATSSFSQDSSISGHTSSIRGTVIDSKTSQPLAGATVALRSQQPTGWNSVTSAADGGFVFQNLPAGRYRLSASRNGYLDSGRHGSLSQAGVTIVTVGTGQSVDSVVVRLIPTGVISGRITNERDEPMPGVLVQSMRASYRTGHRELSESRTSFTDDRGDFRIWGLAPGTYYLKAINPRTWERGPAPAQSYVPMFYPGVYDPAQGQTLELRPGEELGSINLSLSPLRTLHIKGRALTSAGIPAKGAQVSLLQFANSGYAAEAEAGADGRFDLAAVPPGNYVLLAQSQENDAARVQMGRANVAVGDASVDIPDVVVFPGATVSGHVRIEGDRKVALTRSSASLSPTTISDSTSSVSSVTVQADGSFTFRDVPEGEYRVGLSPLPDGYYIRGGRDAGANVVVNHGHAASIELRLDANAGRVQGSVYKDKDNNVTAASCMVVLVPDAMKRADPESYRVTTADRAGKFMLGSIPPGDYSLFAFEQIDRDAYMDPEFLQRNEGAGKSVHVEEGSNLSFDLQVASQDSSE